MVEGLKDVKVVGVAVGASHTVICTDEGRVWTFGVGKSGQLGHGGTTNAFLDPRIVEGLKDVIKVVGVAAGYHHTVICTDEGRVWTFGNGDCGQLGHAELTGHGDKPNLEVVPRIVEGLKDVKVVVVAAGYDHTVICTDEGRVWTFGHGPYGQLGHGAVTTLETVEVVPRIVEGLKDVKVVGVAVGATHTVICTDEGRVWTFGEGTFGQLGHAKLTGHGDEPTLEVVPRIVEGLTDVNVVQVEAGARHTVILSDEGRVWTFGEGKYGQLGHCVWKEGNDAEGHDEGICERQPRRVDRLVYMKVTRIAAGVRRTVICTAEGSVIILGVPYKANRSPCTVDIGVGGSSPEVLRIPNPNPNPIARAHG